MFEIFVRFGWCLCCLLPLLLTGRNYVCIQIHTQCAVASPNAAQKPLVRKRARSRGARRVQVHEPGSRAKKSHTTKSQQPACTHKEHPILTSTEATAFADQTFEHRLGTSEELQDWQKLKKKYVPNNKHVDVCPNGVPALPEKGDTNYDSE